MDTKNKSALLFIASVIILSFFLKASPAWIAPRILTLNVTNLPVKLISISFAPASALVHCFRSLKDVARLKKENRDLKIVLMQFRDAQTENGRLRELFSFKEKSAFSMVAAPVIASDATNVRRSLVIGRGTYDHINVGNPVITPDGVVGMVVEAAYSSSRIILINDPDFAAAGKVKRSEAIGIVSGSLEGSCRLNYLELDADVIVGDEVISLGRESRFPAGIPIGTITHVAQDPTGLTLSAVIKPSVRLLALEEVLVIVNY